MGHKVGSGWQMNKGMQTFAADNLRDVYDVSTLISFEISPSDSKERPIL
jgi:hypothetical protein